MKTKITHLLLLIFILIGAAGCDTGGEFKNSSYISYKFSIFYPQGITNDYEFVFNGKKGITGVVSSSENSGLLEIYSKNNLEKPLFSETVTITANSTITFIKLGDAISIYKADEYVTYTPSLLSNDYSLWFNGYECINNSTNYVPTDKSAGKFEIKDKNASTIWTSTERKIEKGTKYTFMPLTKNEFLEVPEDTEPDPISDKECKVRIFYH